MTYSEFTVCTVLRSTVHSVTVCRLSSGAQSLCGELSSGAQSLYVRAQCSTDIIHSFVIIKQIFENFNLITEKSLN